MSEDQTETTSSGDQVVIIRARQQCMESWVMDAVFVVVVLFGMVAALANGWSGAVALPTILVAFAAAWAAYTVTSYIYCQQVNEVWREHFQKLDNKKHHGNPT